MSATKITNLTAEQELARRAHHAEWLAAGTSTERADRARAEKAITRMYELIGESPPAFLWCDSPATSILGIHVLRELAKQANAGPLGSSLESSLWSSLGSSLHVRGGKGALIPRTFQTVDGIEQDLVDRGHQGWARLARVGKKLAGRVLDGRTWDQFPDLVLAES